MAAPFVTHITTTNERWDLLAWTYYGDPTQFAPIIAANPAAPIAAVLATGIQIVIPLIQLSQTATTNLPPWKLAS
jgi:phage tail protein X